MVDVGSKDISVREATARATVELSEDAADAIKNNSAKKGDVLTVARIAGIGAAKRTDELIPLCHSVPIDSVQLEFHWQDSNLLEIKSTAKATGRTGVEMEALVA
ncbi:MAG TPA: cyclic pyranopterin monophosphate synthase MoaC, partial [Planctomycetaceae bacterium]|nr:cyclic pyranopterin monophosphate synthase MoaC [Planctomycetaceae bacterium]